MAGIMQEFAEIFFKALFAGAKLLMTILSPLLLIVLISIAADEWRRWK